MAPAGTQLERRAPSQDGGLPATGALAMLARARAVWSTLSPKQRSRSVAVFLMLSGLLVGLLWYGLRTDWRTLYSGLDPDDARQIGLALTQAQIPYDVIDNGSTLRVSAAQLDKARLA